MTDARGEEGQARRRAAAIWKWVRQGVRGALLMRPDWRGLRSTPGSLLLVVLAGVAVGLGVERASVVGDASIYWPGLGALLGPSAILAWACWFAMPPTDDYRDASRYPPDAPTLFALLWVQGSILAVATSCVLLPAVRSGSFEASATRWTTWMVEVVPIAWSLAAAVRLLVRCRADGLARRWLAACVVAASFVLGHYVFPYSFWYATPSAAAQDTRLHLTQEAVELQLGLLGSALDAIKPQRPGVIDVYAITFAPYASEDVFMRESAVVADVMAKRFDASGRTIQLVNNKATVARLPWATPLNLQRAITRIGERMDKDQDVLFIHLTSHGGADGELAANLRPMSVDSVTPQALKQWLDDAGIRNRVISISACFSGSWIAPLANDDALVMTAADADHTSYGCGSRSTLTFFGQAMYDEQLRHTWSFEEAHAASRKLIDQRERAAGKEDGYSNPQISVGTRIRARLKLLEARLAASAAR